MKTQKLIVTCSDCNELWTGYCQLCKQSAVKSIDCFVSSLPKIKPENKNESITFLKNKFDAKYKDVNCWEGIKIKHSSKPKKNVPVQTLPITIDNFFIASKGVFEEIEAIPEGFTKFFSSKSSEYFCNDEKKILIRRSDHWGSNIRFCAWFLNGQKHECSWKWQDKYGKGKRIGSILFSDLIINNAFQPRKKDLEARHTF